MADSSVTGPDHREHHQPHDEMAAEVQPQADRERGSVLVRLDDDDHEPPEQRSEEHDGGDEARGRQLAREGEADGARHGRGRRYELRLRHGAAPSTALLSCSSGSSILASLPSGTAPQISRASSS
jgi:hypothetical protein